MESYIKQNLLQCIQKYNHTMDETFYVSKLYTEKILPRSRIFCEVFLKKRKQHF